MVLVGDSGRLAYQFQARDLHLVMGPTTPEAPVRFRVLIDGLPPHDAHGFDVDEQGNGLLTEQRLYQLMRQPLPVLRAALRDRVSGLRRGRVRLHVRVDAGESASHLASTWSTITRSDWRAAARRAPVCASSRA